MADESSTHERYDSTQASSPAEKIDPEQERTTASDPAQDIPNGGGMAWLQVAGAFFLFFNGWGVVNSFGVFQTFYESDFLKDESSSNISWIGSLQAFLLVIVGVVTGPIYDAGYFRALVFTGTFLIIFGMMMTSIATKYWEVILAQSLVVGIGDGCLFLPSVAIVSQWFTTKKSLATGIAAAGSGLGGVIYPIVFRQLQPRVGFGWATRTIAFIMLATSLVSLLGMKLRVPSPARRKLFDLAAFKEMPYLFFSLGELFGFMGTYVPFFYVSIYAIQRGNTNENLAFYLLPILNSASIFGRILPNFFADKTGPLTVLFPFSGICALLAFCWIGIRNEAGLIVFSVLYGFFSGTFVSLPGPTVISLSPSIAVVGTRMGMSFAFAAFGLLIGNPVAGVLLRKNGWVALQAWCGAANALAAICVLIARVSKSGFRLDRKA